MINVQRDLRINIHLPRLWYGSSTSPKVQKRFQNYANRLNWKDRKHTFTLKRFRKHPCISYNFQIPKEWRFIILRKSEISASQPIFYLYNGAYFVNFILFTGSTHLSYDRQTSSVLLKKYDSSYTYLSFLKSLNELISRFNKPFFLKLKFKGKGYYVYKNYRNTIAPQFGYAHRVYVYSFANSVRFLSKTKVFLFGMSKTDILKTGHNLFYTRPINVFTGRGVRFARQVVYKKTGKIGAYR